MPSAVSSTLQLVRSVHITSEDALPATPPLGKLSKPEGKKDSRGEDVTYCIKLKVRSLCLALKYE